MNTYQTFAAVSQLPPALEIRVILQTPSSRLRHRYVRVRGYPLNGIFGPCGIPCEVLDLLEESLQTKQNC